LVCTTIKEGMECPFMTTSGCSYNGGICHEIVEECNGCKVGKCNMATHVASESKGSKVKINPLKASKRANR